MASSAKYSLKQLPERQRFKASLLSLPGVEWIEKGEQYCDYRLDGKSAGGWLRAKQFTNGTLYLEASSDDGLTLMQSLLSGPALPANGKTAKIIKTDGIIEIEGAYIGTDESGKGDYFGPLVIAGVYVTDQTRAILTELGVMDSKKLNEKQIASLRQQIIQTVSEQAVSVVTIGPAKYNELYARFKRGGKNLNHLLAWGHATAIENLLTRFPACSQAIADQFGSEHYIRSQLKEKGQAIRLHQTHRAEANVGVAAASILARYHFTARLAQLGQQYGVQLPFGAGPQVKVAAKELIARHGQPVLGEVAKLHFKTTQELLA